MEDNEIINQLKYRSFIVITSKDGVFEKILVDKEFNDNSQLIDSLPLVKKYGNKAFLVNREWLEKQIENEQLS